MQYQGLAYRATSYDKPLWVNPNRRNGRWNRAGRDITQYTCLDADTPFAEMLRGEDLRTEPEARTFTTVLWQLELSESAIVDYRTFEKADAAGFPVEALVEDDHERCQAEADRLRRLSYRGIASPSAALAGRTNLALFGPRVGTRWSARVTLASMVPAQPLSEGSAPAGLVERVRFYGEGHAGLVNFGAAQA